jgi:hypothetical protein
VEPQAFELTAAEEATLDRLGEIFALSIEDACPRLSVRAVDLEIGLPIGSPPMGGDATTGQPAVERGRRLHRIGSAGGSGAARQGGPLQPEDLQREEDDQERGQIGGPWWWLNGRG